ncbi:uncharacterized protein J8A68_002463 [[Candida] subhashii]|uniref:Uncharacterized protein n=1 Tax=[Candida] subhashii TaxID=561895 RepID=A0A8J5UY12_9ASCO|nr:uncharacterized protein J8A68_002463 [[Candida] subhashii]KAG7664025.1 hypothetical protein J8A68_002463 [[Candida] subhashii]
MDQFYINNYVKFVWIILSHGNATTTSTATNFKSFQTFNTKYGKFIQDLIINSQLSQTNLLISLYYLYKYYHHNDVLTNDTTIPSSNDEEEIPMTIYLIIISLVLANKSFDDQSYTLKTWLIIINNTKNSQVISLDLKLLNYLEGYFLSALGFKLSYISIQHDQSFWNVFSGKSLFKLSKSIVARFRAVVDNSSLLSSPATTTTLASSIPISYIGHPAMIDFSSPALSTASSMSPTSSTTTTYFSSPVGYDTPLTPITPVEGYITASSSKRRRLTPPTYQQRQQFQQLPPPSQYSLPMMSGVPSLFMQQQQFVPAQAPMYTQPMGTTMVVVPALPSQQSNNQAAMGSSYVPSSLFSKSNYYGY